MQVALLRASWRRGQTGHLSRIELAGPGEQTPWIKALPLRTGWRLRLYLLGAVDDLVARSVFQIVANLVDRVRLKTEFGSGCFHLVHQCIEIGGHVIDPLGNIAGRNRHIFDGLIDTVALLIQLLAAFFHIGDTLIQ